MVPGSVFAFLRNNVPLLKPYRFCEKGYYILLTENTTFISNQDSMFVCFVSLFWVLKDALPDCPTVNLWVPYLSLHENYRSTNIKTYNSVT